MRWFRLGRERVSEEAPAVPCLRPACIWARERHRYLQVQLEYEHRLLARIAEVGHRGETTLALCPEIMVRGYISDFLRGDALGKLARLFAADWVRGAEFAEDEPLLPPIRSTLTVGEAVALFDKIEKERPGFFDAALVWSSRDWVRPMIEEIRHGSGTDGSTSA